MSEKAEIIDTPMEGVWYKTSEYHPAKSLGKILAYSPQNKEIRWRIVDSYLFYSCIEAEYWMLPVVPEE